MEFQQAIHNLIKYADRIKDLDREIVRVGEFTKELMFSSSENGLIQFEHAKIIHDSLMQVHRLRQEIEEAEKAVSDSKSYLLEHLLPFEGRRIIYQYATENNGGRTCQVF